MKKLTIILFFVFSSLMAQVSLGLKVSGGGAFPTGPSDFKDNWKMGYNVGGGLTINILGTFAIEGEADYNNFALDADKMLKSLGASNMGVNVSGGNISILSIMANLKLYLIPKVSPLTIYIFGGGGYTSLKFDDAKVTAPGYSQTVPGSTENKVGIQAGAGVQIGVGSISLFVEGKYVTAFTEDKNTSFVPVKAGLIFGL